MKVTEVDSNEFLDIDECAIGTDNCDANALCINTNGSFTCMCQLGYAENGENCAGKNICDPIRSRMS